MKESTTTTHMNRNKHSRSYSSRIIVDLGGFDWPERRSEDEQLRSFNIQAIKAHSFINLDRKNAHSGELCRNRDFLTFRVSCAPIFPTF